MASGSPGWSVGERPALVTVSSPLFGTKYGFTDSHPELFADESLDSQDHLSARRSENCVTEEARLIDLRCISR
jgi:hypothetical protein